MLDEVIDYRTNENSCKFYSSKKNSINLNVIFKNTSGSFYHQAKQNGTA